MRNELSRLLHNPRLWQLALAVYWLALFIATHIPVERVPRAVGSADKVVHVLAFMLLSAIFATTWQVSAGRLNYRHLIWAWMAIVLYGALEESTQPFVNRTASLMDWLADATGAAIGVLLFACVRHVRERGSHAESN
jgi:VanZ family protein